VQIRSAVLEIFEAQTNKKVTDGAKTEPYVRAVIIILLQHFTVA